MKKTLLFLILLLSFAFISCEFSNSEYEYEINLLSVSLDYQNTNVNNLYGTLNDAKEVEKAIRLNCEKQEINYIPYKYYQIGTGYNSATINDPLYPSKTHILSALDNLATVSHDNSINIIYFSGHSNEEGSWLLGTTDTTNGNTYSSGILNEEQLITVDEIYNKLKDLNGKNLLIVDSCFSGNFYKENSYSLEEENMSIANAYKKFISTDSEISNTFILCATEKDNTAHEPYYTTQRLHGYFTKALLEGLGWCDGEKGVLTNNIIADITDDEGIQGILAEGTPPAAINGILSVDALVTYIKENQEIALAQSAAAISYQYPQVSGGRFDLVLFDY